MADNVQDGRPSSAYIRQLRSVLREASESARRERLQVQYRLKLLRARYPDRADYLVAARDDMERAMHVDDENEARDRTVAAALVLLAEVVVDDWLQEREQ